MKEEIEMMIKRLKEHRYSAHKRMQRLKNSRFKKAYAYWEGVSNAYETVIYQLQIILGAQ